VVESLDMSKQQLLQQINSFLDNSPFSTKEIDEWKETAQKLDGKELQDFFNLLKQRLEIVVKANELFIDIADKAFKENKILRTTIPQELYIVDMPIREVAGLIKKNLLTLVKNEKVSIFSQFDQFFKNSALLENNVIEEFDMLAKAILFNKEVFTKEPIPVGRWLVMYNAFKNKILRKSIDRVNFAHQNKEAKKLDKEERRILLKILKFYDFLLDPSNVDIGLKPSGLSKLEQRKFYQESKLNIPEQKETSSREKASLKADSSKLVESNAVRHLNTNIPQTDAQDKFSDKKSAQMADILESQEKFPDSSTLTSIKSISNSKKMSRNNNIYRSSGGAVGNRTPKTQMSKLNLDHPDPTYKKLYQKHKLNTKQQLSAIPLKPVKSKLISKPIKPKSIPKKPIAPQLKVQPVAPKQNENQLQIEKLQKLLTQYAENSLVSEAIKEEIERLTT